MILKVTDNQYLTVGYPSVSWAHCCTPCCMTSCTTSPCRNKCLSRIASIPTCQNDVRTARRRLVVQPLHNKSKLWSLGQNRKDRVA